MQHQTLSQRLHIDFPLLWGIAILCGIGLICLYSASGQDIQFVYKQGIKIIIALTGMCLVAQCPPYRLARWSVLFYSIGVLLLLVVLFFGDTGKGAQRWLAIGLFRFQPSEILKIAVPLFIAWYLSEQGLPPRLGRLLVTGIWILIPVLLIAKQPDLGTALLIAIAGFSVLFIAGISWRLLALLATVVGICLPVFWYLMHDYQRQRVLTFINPEQDPLGLGYHTIQAKIAVGSGGIYGKGWLNGTQSQLDFLPERSTDFIFAVFCEEFGLLGVLLLFIVYLFTIARGLYIAVNAQDTFGKLTAGALSLTFFCYVFINIGMTIGQLPVVGVPLPLLSLGGSAMVTIMASFGILMSIHTHRRLLAS